MVSASVTVTGPLCIFVPILVQQVREGQIGFGLSVADHEINHLGEGCTQLRRIFGDGVNQAADLVSGATSIPSRNLTPLMTFGN